MKLFLTLISGFTLSVQAQTMVSLDREHERYFPGIVFCPKDASNGEIKCFLTDN